MKIHIENFAPQKIIESGQCFRARGGESFRFITGEEILDISALGGGDFELSCTRDKWIKVWYPYFDMDRDYGAVIEDFRSLKNPFIEEALRFGEGIRVLKQDPWETLITFIISQNKNMPAIRKSVALLCERYGHEIAGEMSFPTPEELSGVSESALRECLVGYRDRYILDAIDRVGSGEIDLNNLNALPDGKLIDELKKILGVGEKVANCISLFAYGRTESVPRDVWIKRSIREDFRGEDIYSRTHDAGILQQYVFFYKIRRKYEDEAVSARVD